MRRNKFGPASGKSFATFYQNWLNKSVFFTNKDVKQTTAKFQHTNYKPPKSLTSPSVFIGIYLGVGHACFLSTVDFVIDNLKLWLQFVSSGFKLYDNVEGCKQSQIKISHRCKIKYTITHKSLKASLLY